MNIRTSLLSFAALCLTVQSLAQTATPPAAEPAKTEAAALQAAQPAKTETVGGSAAQPASQNSVSRDKDTLSVDFPDEDIKTILRNVADLFELNLVVPDTLTGKTSIKLRDVTWRQIFHVVLTPAGFNYVEEGNIIKIVSNDSLQQEPVVTEVFVLNNAKAAEIKPTIDGLVDAATGGKILIDARSNGLVVTERPSRMGRIRTIIDQLDKATDQVMIESKFIEVSNENIHNLGVNWSSLAGYNVSGGPFQQNYQHSQSNGVAQSNTATNANYPFITQANAVAGQVVNPPNGAPLVPAPTYAVRPGTGTAASGVLGQPGYVPAVPAVIDATYPNFGGASSLVQTLADTATHNITSVFNAAQFNMVISALDTLSGSKVVSNPTVVTLNNVEAYIDIGEEFPVPSYQYNQQTGSFEVSGFTYKPIGVTMKVTPQVNAKGTIKLSLEPEVSQQAGSTTFGGAGGASIPIISTRKVKTQVSLQSGYTVGIGGLVTGQKTNATSKVPILGSIPGLGRLFSSKDIDDKKTNLLIFITARTLSADGAAPEEVFDPKIIQSTGMSREELLPGQRAGKGSDIYTKPTDSDKK